MTKPEAQAELTKLEERREELLKVLNSKPTKEEVFLSMWTGCTVQYDPAFSSSEYRMKDGKVVFELDYRNKHLWCSYDLVWRVFETESGMDWQEIIDFIRGMVKKHFTLHNLTPTYGFPALLRGATEHFKGKPITL